ncbi:putative membrane protein [Anaplasma phagocytophilum str. ApNP]|uniref:Putative membrane protein n=1 Tax=Anaplasma phagocytophilum str. ApNP TaxID=1359153 RepID=A0A0F3NHL8_ANAPH|nr:putative membrane protein [Anaplasma phagocytophilum str. ApNP]
MSRVPQVKLFATAYRCSGYLSLYLRHVNSYAVSAAHQSVYPMFYTARFAYRKTKGTLTDVTFWISFVTAYSRIFEAFGLSPNRPADLRKIAIITAVVLIALEFSCWVGALYVFQLHHVLAVYFLWMLLARNEFFKRCVLQVLKIVGKCLVEVCAVIAAAIPAMLACVLALYSAILAIPSLLISLPFMLLHATLLTVASSMRNVTSLTLEFIRSAYQVTAEWIRNVRLLKLPGKALSCLWKMLKSFLLACLCLGIHPVEEDVYDLTALPDQSSDKNSQCGLLRSVIAVSVGAVVAVMAGVFSIAATLVSLLALPIVLLGFTLFHHPDVSYDRERPSGTRRLAICFDTSNVPREPRNLELIQQATPNWVNTANTARSSHATTRPANEDINVAAGAQRPGIGEGVQRVISVIAQAFSYSNTRPDTGAPGAICFDVESVSSGLATEQLQRL